MSVLDKLIGPFIRAAGTLLTKRGTINFDLGLTAVDNPTTGWTDVTATGTYLLGKLISSTSWATGWFLQYNSTSEQWEAARGVKVIQAGASTVNEDNPVPVSCASLADGDIPIVVVKAPKDSTTTTVRVCSVTAGVGFSFIGDAGDTETTVTYCVIRPGDAPPA